MAFNKPHYVGHRQRLKDKMVDNNAESFADYELLELLLFSAIPRKDVKPLAKDLLKRFGSLSKLINSDKSKLAVIDGINKNICANIYLVKELINRVLKQETANQNIIGSWSALLDYLKFTMGDLKIEQFRAIFLNKKNFLISDEVMGMGTIDEAPVYPREIIKRGLYHEAGAVILVHNHPSGVAKPSQSDVILTNKIVESCKSVNITVHDHVIIAGSTYYSFKTNMLL